MRTIKGFLKPLHIYTIGTKNHWQGTSISIASAFGRSWHFMLLNASFWRAPSLNQRCLNKPERDSHWIHNHTQQSQYNAPSYRWFDETGLKMWSLKSDVKGKAYWRMHSSMRGGFYNECPALVIRSLKKSWEGKTSFLFPTSYLFICWIEIGFTSSALEGFG